MYVIVLSDNMANHIHKIPGALYRDYTPGKEEDLLPKVKGYDFNKGVDHSAMLRSYLNTGLQATKVGLAIQEIRNMVRMVVHRENFDECSVLLNCKKHRI